MYRHRKPEFWNACEEQPAGGFEKFTARRRGWGLLVVGLLGLTLCSLAWRISAPGSQSNPGNTVAKNARHAGLAALKLWRPGPNDPAGPIPCDVPFWEHGEHVKAIHITKSEKVLHGRHRLTLDSELSTTGMDRDAYFRLWLKDMKSGQVRLYSNWSKERSETLIVKPGDWEVIAEATTDPSKGAQRARKVATLSEQVVPLSITSFQVGLPPAPPTSAVLHPPTGERSYYLTNHNTVRVHSIVAEGTPHSIQVNGMDVTDGEVELTMPPGKSVITVFAENAEGATASKSAGICLDTSAPKFDVTWPASLTTAPLSFLFLNSKGSAANEAIANDAFLPRNVHGKGYFSLLGKITDEDGQVVSLRYDLEENGPGPGYEDYDIKFPYVNYQTANPFSWPVVSQDHAVTIQPGKLVNFDTGTFASALPDSNRIEGGAPVQKAYRLRLKARDEANNEASFFFYFKVDTTAPKLTHLTGNNWLSTALDANGVATIQGPLAGVLAETETAKVYETSAEPFFRAWMGGPWMFRTKHPLNESSGYAGSVTVEDLAGNTASRSFTAMHYNSEGVYRDYATYDKVFIDEFNDRPGPDVHDKQGADNALLRTDDDYFDTQAWDPPAHAQRVSVQTLHFDGDSYLPATASWLDARSFTCQLQGAFIGLDLTPANSQYANGIHGMPQPEPPETWPEPTPRNAWLELLWDDDGADYSNYMRATAEESGMSATSISAQTSLNYDTSKLHRGGFHSASYLFSSQSWLRHARNFEFPVIWQHDWNSQGEVHFSSTLPRKLNLVRLSDDLLDAGVAKRLYLRGYFGSDLKPGDPVSVNFIPDTATMMGGGLLTGAGAIQVLPIDREGKQDFLLPASTCRVVCEDFANWGATQTIEVLALPSHDALGPFKIEVSGTNVVDCQTEVPITYNLPAMVAVRRMNVVADANHDGAVEIADAARQTTPHGVVMAAGFGKTGHPAQAEPVQLKLDALLANAFWMDKYKGSVLKQRGILTLRCANPLVRFLRKEAGGAYTPLQTSELMWWLEDTNADQDAYFNAQTGQLNDPDHYKIFANILYSYDPETFSPVYTRVDLADDLRWVSRPAGASPTFLTELPDNLYVDFHADDKATVELSFDALQPRAHSDSYAVTGTQLSVASPGVLANDRVLPPQAQLSVYQAPAHGDVTLNADGSFTYTLTEAGFQGVDAFVYQMATPSNGTTWATVSLFAGAPGNALLSPVAGETWLWGTPVTILWDDWGTPASVQISRNGGRTWETLSASASGGSFDWTVSGGVADTCLVRVLEQATGAIKGITASSIRIVPVGATSTAVTKKLDLAYLSNGLGAADGIAPSLGAVPGLASVSLSSGNLHLGETVRAYHTPALGPNVSVSYDSMEGLQTGLGRGWRTHYDLRLFDTSVDLNRDGDIATGERLENDLLVLVLGDGARAVFQYKSALKRFVADPKSRVPGAQIGVDPIGPDPVIPANWFEAFDPEGERGFAYVLNLNSNLLFYFNADGRLVRVENMQKKGLTVARDHQGHALRVDDDYGRFEDLRAASFGTGGESPGTIAGRQANGWSFQYVQDPGSEHKRISKVILPGVATYGFGYDPTSRKVTAIKLPNPDTPNAEPGNPFTRTITYTGTTGATLSEIYGGASSYAFDPALDALSAVTDAAGLVTNHELKPGWRLVEKIRAGSRYQESFTWDEKANRTGRSVQGGTSETWVYVSPADIPGSNLLQSHALAGAGDTVYDYFTESQWAGLTKSVTNPCSERTVFVYGQAPDDDHEEFLLSTEFIDPKVNAAQGRKWTVTSRNTFGQPLIERSPSGAYTREYAWSDTGLLRAEKDLFGFATSFSYDLKDRRVLTTQPGGASSGQAYDALNRPTVARDVNGRTTETQYDGLGRVKKVIQKDEAGLALIADLDTSYEVAGSGLRVTTKRGQRILSIEQHDLAGRVVTSYAPLDENPTDASPPPADLAAAEAAKLTTTFVYDAATGWLSQVKRWADGATELVTTYTHDDAGRVVQTAAPGGKVSRTVYHQAGWVAQSHQPGHAPGASIMTRTEFDGCGRPETQFLPTAQADTTGVGFVLTGYEYGQVKYRVDSKGKEESFEYTADGLLAAHADLDGNRTENEYLPAQNKIVTRHKRNGRANHETVTDLFDNRGLPDASTSDLSGETDYAYGDDGLLVSTTPPGFASPFTVSRDKLYRERATSGPFGSSRVDYTEGPAALGDLTQATSARGLLQSFAVEPNTGAVFNVQDNEHAGVDLARVLARNKLGEVTANQDAAGLQWQRTPDYANRTVQMDRLDAADARWRKVTYTPSGLPEKAETQGLPGAAQFTYNALGQPIFSQDAAGLSATRAYDELGRLTKLSAGGRETSYVYEDTAPYGGRIKNITVLGRGTTHYTYYADGLIKEIEDPKGYKTRFEFDEYGRLETIIYPDDQVGAPRREHFAYDTLNRPFQKTDRAGRTHTFFYNDRNLVIRREIADGANVAKIHYTHDADGTLLSERLEGGGTYAWNYDKRGRPIQDGDCAYTYRPDNQVATKTHTPSSRTFALGYVAAGKHKGLLESVQTPDGHAAFAYDDWGRAELLTLPGNVTRRFLRDSAGRVTSMTQIAGALTETFAYARNGWGGLTNMTVTGANAYERIWTYDPGGRLIGEERTGAGAYTNTFTYDANDNRETFTHTTGPVTTPRLWDFAGIKPPPELDTVEGAWTVSDGELIGTAEDGFGPPHALVPTGPGDDRAYSVALRIADDQEIRTTETRFAGLGLRAAQAAGRYEVGLDVRRLQDESLQRRLALRWVPDGGAAEVLAATSYVAYAGESLTLSAEVDAANVLTAQFAQDATPGLTQTLAHGYNGELSLDVSGNRRPAIVQVSANPNPAYLGGGGETPAVIIQDEWPALIQAYFDNLAWSNTGPGTSTTRTYQYNAFNQLTRADDAQGWEEYLYDALGHLQERIDRKAPGDPAAITGRILYGHDALDRVTSVSVNPGFGAAGSEVLSAYTYLAATNKRASATVTPFGQAPETTTYQWSGASLAGQTTGASTTWYGALGATPMWERTGATTYTYLEDGNQNVQAHWNATTGAIESQFAYDAYGKRSVLAGSPGAHASAPGYRGLLHDTDTKHGYFNARIKPEGEANFTDRDPIGMQGGMNQFSYCAGDPVNCWDPLGTAYIWFFGGWHHIKGTSGTPKPPDSLKGKYQGEVFGLESGFLKYLADKTINAPSGIRIAEKWVYRGAEFLDNPVEATKNEAEQAIRASPVTRYYAALYDWHTKDLGTAASNYYRPAPIVGRFVEGYELSQQTGISNEEFNYRSLRLFESTSQDAAMVLMPFANGKSVFHPLPKPQVLSPRLIPGQAHLEMQQSVPGFNLHTSSLIPDSEFYRVGSIDLKAAERVAAEASVGPLRLPASPTNPYNISTAGMTVAERAAVIEYAQRTNAWLAQNGRVTVQGTAGTLRSQASAAARTERLRAAKSGQLYQGQAGHVPDTAITGQPNPPAGWLDMPGISNQSAGGGLGSRIGQRVDVITVDGQLPPPLP